MKRTENLRRRPGASGASWGDLFPILGLVVALCPCVGSAAAKVGDVELSIWNSEEFRRQFAESYMAETDIEPPVTEDERMKMQKVLELLGEEKLDDAAALLRQYLDPKNATGFAPEDPGKEPAKRAFSLFGALKKKEEETVEETSTPPSAVFDFTLANICFQQEKLDDAVVIYEQAIDKFPKFRRAWKNMALIHMRQSTFDKAIPALTRVVELGGNDGVTFGLLAFAYSSTEDYLAAETAYRMAILLDPGTMDWKMGLMRAIFKQERYHEAVALCDGLIEDASDQADLWMWQANAYIGLNQPMKAAENYEIVNAMGESTADSLNTLGDIYVNEELYPLAVERYVAAMKMKPDARPNRALRSSKVLAARGAYDETRQLIEEIEELHGDKLETAERKDLLKLRARLAVADGAGDEEVRVLEEIVKLDPLDGEALILLGQHATRNGKPEQAAFYYERAAGIEGFEADAKLRHGQLLVRGGKYAEALPFLRRAQQIKPRDNVQAYLDEVERRAKTR